MCTLKNFPTEIEHCIEYGKIIFTELFDLHIKEMYTSEYHKTFDFTSATFPEKEETVSTSYDLQGRPAKETQKGILVRNGKKVIIN